MLSISSRHIILILVAIIGSVCMWLYAGYTHAENIRSFRDTLSTSGPSLYANHTIEFTTQIDIPPGGYITIRPEDGMFNIPTSTFTHNQVALYVAPPASPYVFRPSTTTPDASLDGVAVVYGTSGEVTVTLNSTEGISADDRIRLLLGNHTPNSTTTDTGIQNPSATGTRAIYIETGGGSESGSARALVAIIPTIDVGPADTRELIPPVRFGGAPSGSLFGIVTTAEVFMETNEFATCRYSTASGTPFYSMGQQFTTTGTVFHSFIASGLLPDTTYSYYVRCIDEEGNINTDDYEISFTIQPFPEGEPGEGDDPSSGGGGEGDGTGSSGSGGGSGGGDTSNSVSGSGGSGGGGGGGGTNNSSQPYESGDATVIISGYAFPGSQVSVLVDGQVVESGISVNSNGSFSYTIPEIARGVYTFGVYAVDRNNVRSSTFNTTFSVAGARTSTLSNVNVMPSIAVSPNPVSPGGVVTFSGYAIPNSTVTLEVGQDRVGARTDTLTASADGSGQWSVTQSTAGFAQGKWRVRARSAQTSGGISTNFSQYTTYNIGGEATPATGNNSDLNRDGKVNLVDFSILIFHWNTDGGTSDPPADINRDGRVSLTDFSIMIFNWTG